MKMLYFPKPSSNFILLTVEFLTAYPPSPSLNLSIPHSSFLIPNSCALARIWRLLLLSFFDDQIRRPTLSIANTRNNYIATLADRLLISHAEKGGKTEQLCKDALATGKPVFTLDSPDNAHLVELGTVPVAAKDPTIFLPRD